MTASVSSSRPERVFNPVQKLRPELKTEAGQVELPLSREPSRVAVPIELVRTKRTAAAAFTLACDASGLDDKEDFSNIKKGKATLQADLVSKFCDVVGNTIYLEWSAYQVGCTLVVIKSAAERRAEAAESRADELQRKLDFASELLRGRA